MATPTIKLLLVDDNLDDCNLFEEALKELPLKTELSVVNSSEQLLHVLLNTGPLPSAIFLDLNMPRKNGIECLEEIKARKRLNDIPILIYSTSFEPKTVTALHSKGAHYYIRKPAEFQRLKQVLYNGILLIVNSTGQQPDMDNFVLQS